MASKTSKTTTSKIDNETSDKDSKNDNNSNTTVKANGAETNNTATDSNKTSTSQFENITQQKTPNEVTQTQFASASVNNVSTLYGKYEDYQLLPDAPWPPPVFVRQGISPQERYYIEHRWFSQWSYFDKKALENKNRYYRTQLIVGIGSVTVPVLVGIRATDEIFSTALYLVTVFISLAVAMATAVESLYTYGENWRSYRSAAEDMRHEKSLYDVKAGRYSNNNQAFIRFVERCEDIIAQQNGRWVQSQEKAIEAARDQGDEFLSQYGIQTGTDEYGNPVSTTNPTTSQASNDGQINTITETTYSDITTDSDSPETLDPSQTSYG